jgi:hypothetical protein
VDVRSVVPAPEQGLEDFFLELTHDDGGEQVRGRKRRGLARLLPRGRR